MAHRKVLIVDDDKLVSWALARDLESDDCRVALIADGESACKAYREHEPDVVLLDLKLPGIDGLETLRRLKREAPDIVVIMMTAYATVQTTVEAVKIGATDYIKKPFSYDELKAVLDRALQHHDLSQEVTRMRHRLKQEHGIGSIIGDADNMRHVFALIRKIARNDATTVLVNGESGTGKDLVAKAIHYESDRSQGPFMAMNCGSMPDTLLESELFGHEKGAFTDAKAVKKGLFELANHGTVLLDEIGDASASLQVKLLRFIEEKTFKRIGGTKDIDVDVRIVAATNRALDLMVKEGSFREDLYYRLNVILVNLPPLRERESDISLLTNFFIDQFNKEFNKRVAGIDPEALRVLMKYTWPGNVRELRNVLERIMILEDTQTIRVQHLPLELTQAPAGNESDLFSLPSPGVALSGVEKQLIQQALQRTGGNQTRAANLLKISRHALRYKMRKHSLST